MSTEATPAEELLRRLTNLSPSRGWVSDEVGAANIAKHVAAWLDETAEMRDSSWLPVDQDQLDDGRITAGRALSALADDIREATKR